ncbi:MAG: hypothetical protein L0H73_14670 [Nitrococcus sp.]|nr:hypothetical protein [Nitrococcus sp.]
MEKAVSDLLEALSFTKYEARAYLALLGGADRNGYEVAKASGIPRANVYSVLEQLVRRGAARRVEARGGRRYAATPSECLLARMDRAHRRSVEAARVALAELATPKREPAVFNVGERDELLQQARVLLDEVESNLLVAIQPTEAAALAPALAAARDRGVSITTLCMEACEADCGSCVGWIHRYGLAPADSARRLVLVADERRMLAAELDLPTTQAIATEQTLIVDLAAAYIRQSLALVTLGGALGERFDGLLSLEARKILDELHPEGGFVTWLRHVAARKTA